MSKQKIKVVVKVVVPSGEATAGPPVGTALGPHGINLGLFCKSVNSDTLKKYEKSVPVPIALTIYTDKTFSYEIGIPSVSYYLKKAAKIDKGSGKPKKQMVATVNMQDIQEIYKIKKTDFTAGSEEAAYRSIMGTARSMGIGVEK